MKKVWKKSIIWEKNLWKSLEICSTWLCTNPESSNQYRNYEN